MEITCKNCKTTFANHIKFCSKCGTSIHKGIDEERSNSMNLVITFYIVFLVFAFAAYAIYDNNDYSLGLELGIELSFAALVIAFSAFDYKNILKLYRLPKMNWKPWVFALAFPVFTAFVVYYGIEKINLFLFEESADNYMTNYMTLSNPLAWGVFFIAILPPIFEELAFRGFLFNQLEKVATKKVTIIATAFLFALVHFSLISLIWIFPFGLVLGYLRSRYNTLWLCMIVHFIHNLIVVLLDYKYYVSDIFLLSQVQILPK